ncbi:MAG: DUF4235 domain-containing protein [Aeromicrobium erythreum]
MATEKSASRSAKVLYRPVGLLSSVLGGIVASLLFKQVWKRLGSDDSADAPGALQSEYSFREVLLASVLQGAIFAAVRTLIDRQGARAFERATGEWPGS